jgi:hypothetical protein
MGGECGMEVLGEVCLGGMQRCPLPLDIYMQHCPLPKVSRCGRKKGSVRPMSQAEGRPVLLRLHTILRYHTIQYTLYFIADLDRSGFSKSFSCDSLFLNLNIEGVKNRQKVIILS